MKTEQKEINKNDARYIDIDLGQLDKLCAIQCTKFEVACFFECSEDTIERRIKEKTGMTFSQYFEMKRGRGKIALRRMQMQTAEKGNVTMLIWLGKQYLGQTDKNELSTPKDGAFQLAYSTDKAPDES
jgi:AraC-like DNA-binding protein